MDSRMAERRNQSRVTMGDKQGVSNCLNRAESIRGKAGEHASYENNVQ